MQKFLNVFGFRHFRIFSASWDVLDRCVARQFATHGLVAMHVRIAHGLNFMDDWVLWLTYRNGHMQLKVKACN